MKKLKKVFLATAALLFIAGFFSIADAATFGTNKPDPRKVNSLPRSTCPIFRLKLSKDSISSDEIVFGFKPTASAIYNAMEDAKFFEGFGNESLSSFSADNIRLSINVLPLPKLAPLVIRLVVDAETSGIYSLQNSGFDTAIPAIYKFWLIDKYKKDSLDIRSNRSYAFNVDKKDTASFGSNRFQLIIREDPALFVHLLDFTAVKALNGAEVSWKAENEQDYTSFAVQRSTDNGSTFKTMESITSDGHTDYSYLDKMPGGVSDIYRLKIEDMNGTVSYSKTVTLVYSEINTPLISRFSIKVYPNPASGIINVATNGETPSALAGQQQYDFSIVNSMGKVVKTVRSSTAVCQQNISDLQPGTYFVQVTDNTNQTLPGKGKFVKF